jgi:hypothetical protein
MRNSSVPTTITVTSSINQPPSLISVPSISVVSGDSPQEPPGDNFDGYFGDAEYVAV